MEHRHVSYDQPNEPGFVGDPGCAYVGHPNKVDFK
jgi:hypothetical protein